MQTFTKEERLYEKKIIKDLFEKGNVFHLNPFKVLWLQYEFDSKYPAKVLISVPTQHFNKATDRNYLKRLIRESYRKNKKIIYCSLMGLGKKIVFVLHYSGRIIISYNEVESKIILILQRLAKEYEKTSD